jgi:DNA-binding PadR family transcriptional regulator/tetratricopeptide (TPR) repeat protein
MPSKARFSDLQLLILASVSKTPKHGHAILRDLASSYGAELGPGALYGAIKRLAQKGLIEALPDSDRRQPYQITPTGLQVLQSQVSTLQRLTVPSLLPQTEDREAPKQRVPAFYEPVDPNEVERELGEVSSKVPDHSADELPFVHLGGRRFEILTYLLKRDELPDAIVTLVKSSGDRGRDVLVHSGGVLKAVIQCKNLDHKFSLPELCEELVKVVLHDYRERFIPDQGILYELWVPGGLTEPAENFIATWPAASSHEEIRKAFDTVVRKYKSLSSLTFEDVAHHLTETLAKRVRFQRHEVVSLSNKIRSSSEVFSRFFEAVIVMRREDVDKYLDGPLGSRLDSHYVGFSEQIANLTEQVKGDAIDDEINEARDFINEHKFGDAAAILRRLQSKKQHVLSKYQRYRIVSNFGAIAVGEGRTEEAARLFLEAVRLAPDEERARVNEVFAYALQRDLAKVFQLASDRRNIYPRSTRLLALWIMSAPSGTPLEELENALDSTLVTDHEVCVALARRAMADGQMGKAKALADTAIMSAPKWSQPWLVRSQAVIGEIMGFDSDSQTLPLVGRSDRIKSAIADSTRSLELAEAEGAWSKAEALAIRCELHLIAGDANKATEDAKTAYKLAPENLNALLPLAQCYMVVGALDRAIEILEEAYAKEARPDAIIMYAKALAERSREGDLQKAVDISTAVDVSVLPVRVRATFCSAVFRWTAQKGDWSAAADYLAKTSPLLDETTVHAFQGFIEHGRGESEAANISAGHASASIDASTDSSTKEFVAGLFMQLGRPADALPLFEELFAKRILSFNPDRLIECAAKLDRHDKVLEICDELYRRRGPDWRLLEFEVQYLEEHDTRKAIDRLQEFLRINPDHQLARLRLSVIGYRVRRPDLIRASMKDLPSVEQLPVQYLGPALGILGLGEDRDLVIDYAYRFLREHFDRQEAHEGYIQAVLTSPDRQYPPTLEVVTENSAVLSEEVPSGELRWFVLEGTDKPVRDFEEISLNDPVTIELMGKKVGDKFILARASVANREAVIKQILPKYVRRFQDCINELQVRFGTSAMLQSVRFGPDTEITQPGLVTLMMSLQERAKQVALLQSSYAEQPLSLHLYGARFGKNSYVALQHIAQTEGMPLKCFDGNPATAEKTMSSLRERPSILLDLSAIATVRLLGLEWIFGTKLYRFATTEATWEELQDTFREIEGGGEKGGTLAYRDEKYVLEEEDTQSAAQRKAEDQAFLDSFQANVEIVPARELASIEPKTRDLVVKYLGRYGAQTVVLAGKPGVVMWCDDVLESQLATTIFGGRSAWTQMILVSLTEAGILAETEYRKIVAKLIGMGFTSVYFDARCVLESTKLSEYRIGRFPLKQMIEVFQQANSPANDLLRQFLGFFVLLQQEPSLIQQKSLVIHAFLNALWRNPATHDSVLSLRSVSAKLFGLNVVAEAEFNRLFHGWLKSLNRPII